MTLAMEVRDDHNHDNLNITGEYKIIDVYANGRNYYANAEAKRYLYSSPKGIWFVCEQYTFGSSSMNV